MKYFFVNYFFLYKLKTSLGACFFWHAILIFQQIVWINTGSRSQVFFKIGNLRNNHRKTPVLKPLFNKFGHLKPYSFIRKRLQHRCFHVNIAKFLIAAFFIKHLRWLLLNKVKTNLRSTWFILLPDWLAILLIKPIKTFNSETDTETETRKTKT